jgi:vacuolar-type H+-ATPase subunit H
VADKKFLSWVGFKGEDESANKPNLAVGSASLERIRELESQINDLRSRRDITSLSKEEFEILATETAMSIIRTAQQRESKANTSAERVLSESKKQATSTIELAEAKAKSALAQAESRGRKYIEAAESDAASILSKAESEAEDLLNSKKREGSTITSNAKREAERLVLTATTEVSEYRNWLAGVISEAERLYRIQTQSLDAAESAISQSRQRLESAFNRLAELQKQVVSAIQPDGTPTGDSRVSHRIAQAQSQNSGSKGESSPLQKKKSTSSALKSGGKAAKSNGQKKAKSTAKRSR